MPPRTVDAPPKRAAHAAEGRHRPIIILTARASESSKIEGIETGADDYLIKPFSATELRARVKNLIELRRLLRQRFSGATVIKPSEVSATDVNERGWAGGDGSARQAAMRALANDYPEEPMATDGISYLDIHDNWTLADRYALSEDHDGLEGVHLAAVRIAAGLLLTSAGPLVIHGGTEMLRSKGLAPHEELEVELANGPIRFKGRDDTYNLRAPNRFLWEHLAPSSEHAAMRGYWRGLLALRMSDYGRVFRVAEVPDGHYRWITPDESTLLGYVVGGRVLVLANSGEREGGFRFDLPHGDWRQVGDRERVDLDGVDGEYACLSGGRREVRVPGGAFLV